MRKFFDFILKEGGYVMKNRLSQVLEQSRTRTQVLEQPRNYGKNIQERSVYVIT